jgi:hypothetical protein
MLNQMTKNEKESLLYFSFEELWERMWNCDQSRDLLFTEEEIEVAKKRLQNASVNMNAAVNDSYSSFSPRENVVSLNEICSRGLESSICSNNPSKTDMTTKSIEKENIQYRHEELNSKIKFKSLTKGIQHNSEFYSLSSLIEESNQQEEWEEQEWGFPKGRRNYQENEYDCAVREFTEETGYPKDVLKLVSNIYPFEEVFMGSNYKSYKHKYFLTYMDYEDTQKYKFVPNTEVSKIEWLSLEDCISNIRSYNEEKKKLIMKVNNSIKNYLS